MNGLLMILYVLFFHHLLFLLLQEWQLIVEKIMNDKIKRPRIPARIVVGQVVASTNYKQYSCCRALTILQRYNSLTYERIARYVKHDN